MRIVISQYQDPNQDFMVTILAKGFVSAAYQVPVSNERSPTPERFFDLQKVKLLEVNFFKSYQKVRFVDDVGINKKIKKPL